MLKRIAILGGGTAGWLAANHLAVELRSSPVEITLIESKDIGIIGVGEGTVPYIKKSLQKFGISEVEMLLECDATFKTGIKFENWLTSAPVEKNFYYHPFSSPFPNGYDVTPFYLKNSSKFPFSDVSTVVCLSEKKLCPKRISSVEFQGALEYAYHFDAHKFGKLLARNACGKLGVLHRFETIVDAEIDTQGNIDGLITKEGEKIAFDFYVDCSGFSAKLIENKLAAKFIEKSNQIPTNQVLTCQIPTENESPISPFTLAQAHGNGWIWDIPLTTRRGVGFVYSSDFISVDQAHSEFAKYLGVNEDTFEPRKLAMKIGFREKFWVKNCVALGLAQGFVEPLEATSILVTDFSAELFARTFSLDSAAMVAAANYFNRAVSYTWERVMDFVQLHYLISNRRDTDFWKVVTEGAQLSEVLAERLAMWRSLHPKKSDFFSRFDLFDVDNYLYVLYGMKFNTAVRPMLAREEKVFLQLISSVKADSEQLSRELLGQREWLTKFKAAAIAMRQR